MNGTDLILKYFPELPDDRKEKFLRIEPLYREWNSNINVISRKDIDSLYLHHVLHSLGIAAFIREKFPDMYIKGMQAGNEERIEILDLGTGGGFPGIPLAVMFPGFNFTLCDSIGKKIKVVSAVSQGLGLENVTAVNARAEDIGLTFDYVVSRAVTSLDRFLPWVKNRYRKGIIYLKGGDLVEEITVAAMKNKVEMSNISVLPLERWFKEEFFSEKKVVFICKSN